LYSYCLLFYHICLVNKDTQSNGYSDLIVTSIETGRFIVFKKHLLLSA